MGEPAADFSRMFHVVLVAPEIAGNTGAVGRTCVAVGAMLWLVRPLGFIIDRGKNNGFDESTRFMVFGQPRVVVNPNTGEQRTIPGARIGEAKVVEIYEDVAELSLVSGNNSSVTVGAIVRIVEE